MRELNVMTLPVGCEFFMQKLCSVPSTEFQILSTANRSSQCDLLEYTMANAAVVFLIV